MGRVMGIAREVDTIHRDGTTFGIEIQVLFYLLKPGYRTNDSRRNSKLYRKTASQKVRY
jgi:hypothetical protein